MILYYFYQVLVCLSFS